MGLLRLALLGTPEVFHDEKRLTFSSRKALALLLYLAVEGGMHPRSKLAAFLWPDSEPQDARHALRNAIALLRSLLSESDASPSHHTHLLSQHELLGLDPHAPLELDLNVVLQAYKQAQEIGTVSSEEQRADLIASLQQALALVRGPFLDGFWLREETAFDEWVQMLQHQWQVRLPLLFERLSSLQEAAGEPRQAITTLTRWLVLDPHAEEATRHLMQQHLELGDPAAALQVYAACQARLEKDLQIAPSPETVALAEQIHAIEAHSRGASPAHSTTAGGWSAGEPVTPLIGRATAFSQMISHYRQSREGQPHVVLVVGEAGIGKTRLVNEFVAWARSQGADILSGHIFQMDGRLPYQPLVEILRPRLEEENAPEDLLDDLWLAELARLLPELRGRYPDLPAPSEDDLTAKVRLFEAVARLLDALAQRAPLVLLLDDLQWVDEASMDLIRYLARYWVKHGSRVLLLCTVRSEELDLNPRLSVQLADLERDLPVSKVQLQTLNRTETIQLVQSLVGEGAHGTRNGNGAAGHPTTHPSTTATGAELAHTSEQPLVALGDFLFTHTGGQPFYLLETLKLLRDREWLVPRLGTDGNWRLALVTDIEAIVAQEQSRHELLPPSVRAMILARLSPLSQAARHLVMASAVLGNQATAQRLWHIAEVDVQTGVEALEEAVKSGILREEETGHMGCYRITHDLMRDVVYSEIGVTRRQILHQHAFARLESEGARASELAYHAGASGQIEAAYRYNVQAGDEAIAVFALDDAIEHYEQARSLLQEHTSLQDIIVASEIDHLYVCLARAYTNQNAWEQAQHAYEALITYGQQHRLFALVSITLNRLANLVAQHSSDKPQVNKLLEEAHCIAERCHNQKALAETVWNQAEITAIIWEDPKSALPHGKQALSLAQSIHDHELEARCLRTLGLIHSMKGNFEETIHCAEEALARYAALDSEPPLGEHSLPHVLDTTPLIEPMTNRTAEAFNLLLLAIMQAYTGQAQDSIRNGNRALASAKESKHGLVQVVSAIFLAYGLLEAGAYEESLTLLQDITPLVWTLPQKICLQVFFTVLGNTYQALQQWEEARAALEEAVAVTETLGLGLYRVSPFSQLAMNYVIAKEWDAAYTYTMKAITLRKSSDVTLYRMDFYWHAEIEALLHEGDERQARAEVQDMGERVGPNRRYRLPYLRSLAVLAAWEGHTDVAIDHLREAAHLAADLSLPGEQWQIQAALGSLYEAEGALEQAQTAFAEASSVIQELAQNIQDAAKRSRFLAGPQVQPVLQCAQKFANL